MRGCLAVLVLAAAFSIAAVWIAGPPIASGLVTVGLGLAGLDADETAVTVVADPPPKLLTGRADRILVRATNASFGDLTATSLELELVDVGLVDRRAASVSGRLDGIVAGATDERLAITSITFDGAGDEADATARVAADAIEAVAAQAIEDAAGQAPGSVTLAGPDLVAFTVGGVSAQARLAADDAGNIVALGVPGASGPTVLVRAASTAPLQVDGLSVAGDELILSGKLDLAELLR
jgi:hypothetical protein